MNAFDLRLGDCAKEIQGLGDGTIDLVVTSPPYNLGIAYSRYSDRQNRDDYLNWCHDWAAELRRGLESARSLFFFFGAAPSKAPPPPERLLLLPRFFVP